MYNTDLPQRADLPSAAQLKRSTMIAASGALALLVTVVLPSEYAIDPTGLGRLMGLTEMGEIKQQLAEEAALDAAAGNGMTFESPLSRVGMDSAAVNSITMRLDRIEAQLTALSAGGAKVNNAVNAGTELDQTIAALTRPEPMVSEPAVMEAAAPQWRDELSFVLVPGQGAEVKLVMQAGASADFFWTANGSVVNYDTHGDGGGRSISYEKGRGVAEQEGALTAAFDGNHGWFWRNRTRDNVTVTLRARGDYIDMKRVM